MTSGGPVAAPVEVRRDRPTWVSYVQISLYGWVLYAFGPSLALLREEQGTTRSVASLHGTALAVGSVLAAFAVAPLVARIGRGTTLRVGTIFVVLGILGYASIPALPLTLAGTFVLGVGATLTLAGINAFFSDHQGPAAPRALSESNGLGALTGLLGPLTVGLGVALTWGWRPALLAAAACFVALEVWRGRRLDVYDGTHGHPADEPGHAPPGPLPRLYWATWFVLMASVGVEFSLTLWGSDLLRERAGLGDAAAAAALATVVGGMALGRLGGSALLARRDPERMLAAAYVVTLAGFALAWLSTSALPMLAGFAVAGTGMGLQWPLGIARALRASGGRTDRASGMASVAAGIASGAAPFVLASLADHVGVHTAFLVVPVLAVVALTLVLLRPVPLTASG